MVEPVTTALAGIALVTKSIEFIKSNIQTAQDIGQFVGAIENAFEGEKQCLKAREKKGADPFATENVAKEIIDAKKTFQKYRWPSIDVTRKSVEETAASIIKIHEIYLNNVK